MIDKPIKEKIELLNEEEIRGKLILPYINALGLKIEEVQLEKSFKIKLGKKTHDKKDYTPNGRADILCKIADKNLFIFELKADSVKIKEEDIDQGISYARLLHPMAPFVIISNGKETQVIDTITKEKLNSDEIKKSNFVKNKFTLSIENDISLRYEALKYFIGYSNENIKIFSNLQNESKISTLIGGTQELNKKYIPELFIERKPLKNRFEKFKVSDEKSFLILGESGVGKTNSLCKLIEEASENDLVLFYRGSFLSKSLFEIIKDDFNWFFSSQHNEIEIFRNLDKLVGESGKKVYIFIDAIDEIPLKNRALEIEEICKALDRFNNIKLCVSCKVNSWDEFRQIRGIKTTLNCQAKGSTFTLERFDYKELEEAILKYSKVFNIKGEFSNELKEYCKLGFHLKMIGELFSNEIAPEHISSNEIAKKYLELKAVVSGLEKRELIRVFSEIGKLMCSKGNKYINKVREDKIIEIIGKDIDNSFYAYNLLDREEDDYGRGYVGFYYTQIADIIIALYSYELDNLTESNLEKIIKEMKLYHAGISSLLWFEGCAASQHAEVFIRVKKQEALDLVNKYEKVLESIFPKIKNRFEPFTANEIGIAIDDKPSPFINAYGFYEKIKKDDKVTLMKLPGNERWFEKGIKTIHYRYLKNAFKFNGRDILFNIEDIIYKQLRKIVENGELSEEKSIVFSIEKILNLVYHYGKEIGYTPDDNRRLPNYKSILPLNLEELEYKVRLNNAEEYYENKQVKELLEKGIIKSYGNSYSYNRSILDYKDIKLKAEESLKNNIEIPIYQNTKNALIINEINVLKNRNIKSLTEEILPSPDIKREVVTEKLINNNLSYTYIPNIYYASFSEKRIEEYFRKLFSNYFNEYLKMVENNFNFLKDEFELYKNYPLKVLFKVDRRGDYLVYDYSVYSHEREEIFVNGNFEKTSFEENSENGSYIFRTQTLEFGFFQDMVRISKNVNTSSADKCCIIRGLVYKKILDELDKIEDKFKMGILQVLNG